LLLKGATVKGYQKNPHYDGDTKHGRRADILLAITILIVIGVAFLTVFG